MLGRLVTDGYCVLSEVFDARQVALLLRAVDEAHEAPVVERLPGRFEGRSTNRTYNLLTRSQAFWAVATDSTILSAVHTLLGNEPVLSSYSAITILPGEVAQPVHADDECFPMPKPHSPLECVAMVALTAFTEDNGATQVIPGSHRWDHHPDWRTEWTTTHPDLVPVQMSPGDVLLYNGSLWHAAGANRSTSARTGLAICYALSWLRTHENPYLGISKLSLRAFPPEVRSLIGLSILNGSLNHVEGLPPDRFLEQRQMRHPSQDPAT